MRTRALLLAVALCGGTARADVPVEVCFNYGCVRTASVRFAPERLEPLHALLAASVDAVAERAALARAVGELYRAAGEQSPVAADRAGNYLDQGVDGRMDCIDHSTTTTRLLTLLESQGWLRFHRVLPPARRAWFLFQHFSAVVEEVEPPAPAHVPAPPPVAVPDHVPLLLALCDCPDVLGDLPPAPPPPAAPVVAPRPAKAGARFAIDSWFVDHGDPAVVLPLAEWLNGEGPNVQ